MVITATILVAWSLVSVLAMQQWVFSCYMPQIPRNDNLLCLGNSEMLQLVLRTLEMHRKCYLLLTVIAT